MTDHIQNNPFGRSTDGHKDDRSAVQTVTCAPRVGPAATVRDGSRSAAGVFRDGLDGRTLEKVQRPGSGHIGPLLQAALDVAALVTAFWRDPRGQEPTGRGGAG